MDCNRFFWYSVNATQTVTGGDTTGQTIKTLPLITVEATNKDQNYVELGTIVATDLVGITSITNDAPQVFSFGLTTLTWTVQDKAGNSVNATQQISVIDTTVPSIIAPDNLIIEAVSLDNNIVDLGNAIATDEVEVSSITNNAPSVFQLGDTVVTWTATDSSGNSVNAIQTVTVVDTTSPTIETLPLITVEATNKDQNYVELGTIVATDLVGITSIT